MALLNTPICDFGAALPGFALSDPQGARFTNSDLMGENGLLVMFICNHCPYVRRIAQGLSEVGQTLQARGIGVVAIMSNDFHEYPDDAPDRMTYFAQQSGFTFPYLVDETQEVGQEFGAVCTPDFFGYNSRGLLQYRGNFDHLEEAMTKIAHDGAGPLEQIPSMGCSIKWSM